MTTIVLTTIVRPVSIGKPRASAQKKMPNAPATNNSETKPIRQRRRHPRMG
jgi:hypothetical protein